MGVLLFLQKAYIHQKRHNPGRNTTSHKLCLSIHCCKLGIYSQTYLPPYPVFDPAICIKLIGNIDKQHQPQSDPLRLEFNSYCTSLFSGAETHWETSGSVLLSTVGFRCTLTAILSSVWQYLRHLTPGGLGPWLHVKSDPIAAKWLKSEEPIQVHRWDNNPIVCYVARWGLHPTASKLQW